MSKPDFFLSRLNQIVDLRRVLAVLPARLPQASIKAMAAPELAHPAKPAQRVIGEGLASACNGEFGGHHPASLAAVQATGGILQGRRQGSA